MQSVALLSGLIGALISAGLSYWIRATLDRRNVRDAESRLAYVYFVRVSEFVAMETVVKWFISSCIKVYANDQAKEALSSKDGSFGPSHKVCVLIAKEIQKLTPEKLKETPSLSIIPVFLKSQLEAMSESKLSAEQLSTLPRETVLTYSLFLTYLTHLRGTVLLWTVFFEQQNISWVTPEAIHDQWLAIARFFEHAHKLRVNLLSAGAASTAEASALLHKQISAYNEVMVTKLQHQPKLQAAMAEVNKSAADETKT